MIFVWLLCLEVEARIWPKKYWRMRGTWSLHKKNLSVQSRGIEDQFYRMALKVTISGFMLHFPYYLNNNQNIEIARSKNCKIFLWHLLFDHPLFLNWLSVDALDMDWRWEGWLGQWPRHPARPLSGSSLGLYKDNASFRHCCTSWEMSCEKRDGVLNKQMLLRAM